MPAYFDPIRAKHSSCNIKRRNAGPLREQPRESSERKTFRSRRRSERVDRRQETEGGWGKFWKALSIHSCDIGAESGRVGATPRERRDASILALSHRPSRAASDSLCAREKARVHTRVTLRVANVPQSLSVAISLVSHRHPRFQWNIIFSSRETAIDRLREREWKSYNYYSLSDFWIKREEEVEWWCRRGSAFAGADPEGNAFLWRRSGDSQDPSPPGDVGKSRSVLLFCGRKTRALTALLSANARTESRKGWSVDDKLKHKTILLHSINNCCLELWED